MNIGDVVWTLFHFKQLGYDSQILRDEDNFVYTFDGQKFGGKPNGYFDASLDLIHAMTTKYISEHPELTVEEIHLQLNIFPEHPDWSHFCRINEEAFQNDIRFRRAVFVDLPPLKDGSITLSKKIIWPAELTSLLTLFKNLGYEAEISRF